MEIEGYDFGVITIGGRTYTGDVKMVRGKVVPNWWRKEGHNLLPEDIGDVLEAKPEVLVVGTGHDGLMHISPTAEQKLAEAGIDLVARPTRQACEEYNRMAGSRDVAFAAHLTC